MQLKTINPSLAAKLLGPLVSFATIFYVSVYYDASGVGFYTGLMQSLVLLGIFARFGADFVLMKGLSEFSTDSTNLALVWLVLRRFSITLCATIVGLYFLLEHSKWQLFSVIGRHGFLLYLALVLSSSYVFLLMILVARKKYFESTVFQSVVTPVVMLITIVSLPKTSDMLLAAVLFGFLFSLVSCWGYIYGQVGGFVSARVERAEGYAAGFSVSLSEAMLYNSDIVLLSFFVSLDALGAYAIATRLASIYGFFVQINNVALVSDVAGFIKSKDREGLLGYNRLVIQRNLAFALVYLSVVCISGHAVTMLLGEQYGEVFTYAFLLAIPGFVGCLLGFTITLRFLLNDSFSTLDGYYNTGFMVTYGLLFVFFAWSYGIVGAISFTIVAKLVYYGLFYLRLVERVNNV
jgi:O-antigen/teichoic acid export membrane protein